MAIFDIVGFSTCEMCGKRELDVVDSEGNGMPLTPKDLTKEFDIVCPECCESINTTIIILPPDLPKKYLTRIQVEYDETQETPLSFSSEEMNTKKKVEILRTKIFVRLPNRHVPENVTFSTKPFGIYIVEIQDGDCMIEAQPHIEADGTENWNTPEWYLMDANLPSIKMGKVETNKKSILDFSQPTNYNFKAYRLLNRLEPELREFIFFVFNSKYQTIHGKKWWKAVIPKDVIEQIEKAMQTDKQNPLFTESEELHPICYTTFAHFSRIIDYKWEDFKDILYNKKMVLGDLKGLEFLRNMVAHNRSMQEKHYRLMEEVASRFYKALRKYKKQEKGE